MIDIEVNLRGDVVLKKTESRPALKLTIGKSPYPILHFPFKSGKNFSPPNPIPPNSLSLSFDVGPYEQPKESYAIRDIEELRQRIMVLLRTELGEIHGEQTYGARIPTYKHLDITKPETLSQVQEHVYEMVSPLLTSPRVEVRRKKLPESHFYNQNLFIYIYDGKTEVYNFILEE